MSSARAAGRKRRMFRILPEHKYPGYQDNERDDQRIENMRQDSHGVVAECGAEPCLYHYQDRDRNPQWPQGSPSTLDGLRSRAPALRGNNGHRHRERKEDWRKQGMKELRAARKAFDDDAGQREPPRQTRRRRGVRRLGSARHSADFTGETSPQKNDDQREYRKRNGTPVRPWTFHTRRKSNRHA